MTTLTIQTSMNPHVHEAGQARGRHSCAVSRIRVAGQGRLHGGLGVSDANFAMRMTSGFVTEYRTQCPGKVRPAFSKPGFGNALS